MCATSLTHFKFGQLLRLLSVGMTILELLEHIVELELVVLSEENLALFDAIQVGVDQVDPVEANQDLYYEDATRDDLKTDPPEKGRSLWILNLFILQVGNRKLCLAIGHLKLRAISCQLVEGEERGGWQNEKFNSFPNEVSLGEARLLTRE